jgi:hypothetical protein
VPILLRKVGGQAELRKQKPFTDGGEKIETQGKEGVRAKTFRRGALPRRGELGVRLGAVQKITLWIGANGEHYTRDVGWHCHVRCVDCNPRGGER